MMEEEEVEKEVAEKQDHQERSERHLDSLDEDIKGFFLGKYAVAEERGDTEPDEIRGNEGEEKRRVKRKVIFL